MFWIFCREGKEKRGGGWYLV